MFDFIHGHPTIASLSLSRVVKSQSANAIALDSSVERPSRSSPLKIPVVVLDSTDHAFSELFLLFLRRHSIRFPRVEFLAYDPMPTFLAVHRMPSLDWLLILAAPVAFQRTFGFIPRLAQAQSTLEHIDLDFVAFGPNETFELGEAWPTWQVGTGLVPIGSTATGAPFVEAWRGIKLTEVKMMSMKLDDAYPSLAADYDWDDGERAAPWLRLNFAPGTVLPIKAIRALSEELFWGNMFVICSQVGWEDWVSCSRDGQADASASRTAAAHNAFPERLCSVSRSSRRIHADGRLPMLVHPDAHRDDDGGVLVRLLHQTRKGAPIARHRR